MSDDLPDEIKVIEKEIVELFKRHNITHGVCFYVYPEFEFEDINWEESHFTDRRYSAALCHYSDERFLDIDRHPNGYDPNMSVEELQKLRDLAVAHINNSGNGIKTLLMDDRTSKKILAEVDKELGINSARIVPIKPNKAYVVFTEKGQLRVMYTGEDDNFNWTIEVLMGDETPPDRPMRFIGNAQESGEIFQSGDMPLISTGDMMVFGKRDGNLALPQWASAKVLNVIAEEEMN